jgi:uracil-DNA glycosylase
MIENLPAGWRPILAHEIVQPYFQRLQAFLEDERRAHTVYPPEDEVYAALNLTPYENVRVLLLGQDPYHGAGQAHGLAFSVRPGVAPPPSLKNIFKELQSDLGVPPPGHGHLAAWAERGVLLLNAVLTVRAGQANSHKNKGWEVFTDSIIRAVGLKSDRVIFLLWGGYARKKRHLIAVEHHVAIESAHPSPLSARNGFFGSRPFSRANAALRQAGQPEIDWRLPL